MACLKELPGKSLSPVKKQNKTWQHGIGLQSCYRTNKMSFRQTRPKGRCLTLMQRVVIGKAQTQHIGINTK